MTGVLLTHRDAHPDDVATIDAIIQALYETTSFPPGGEPDWDRLRTLFSMDGCLIPPRDSDESMTQVLGIEAFIHRARRRIARNDALQKRGFTEVEIARQMDAFNNIAHVLSVYEGRFTEPDEYVVRGINSMQLLYENDRWWVMGIMWADEDTENPIPDHYIEGKPNR
jgi:hypothetical protein